jgi:hypothetical protein
MVSRAKVIENCDAAFFADVQPPAVTMIEDTLI